MIQVRIKRKLAGFTLDVEFAATAGITVLFGASGAGKTLTLDSIAGFVRPDEGRILLDDTILYDGAAKVHIEPRRRNCGYVFQNYALFPHMSIRENLGFAAARLPRLERHRRIAEMLESFKLTEVAERRPDQLSGGQRQRCSIARALIGRPALLLLDEPARGLDAPLRQDLYEVLRQIRRDFKTPILLVTHDLIECCEIGDEMIVLRGGRVAQTGTPTEILDRPASLDVARLLGLHCLLPAEITHLDPQAKTGRLRLGDDELTGPYFPGHLRGDQVWLCVRQSALKAWPAGSKLKDELSRPNRILARPQSATERPQSLLIDFGGGLAADLPRDVIESYGYSRTTIADDNTEWVVEFPASALQVLSR